ncbi:class I adenylate-forming enzyme family protein [Micromonospora sp. NPDC048894]|uniref:class I adenylate-forming enzyme family protein n=2 Tax=Micromonospora TaxID=1873 RepID=UPI0033D3A92D
MKLRSLQRYLASVPRMHFGRSHRGLRARLELLATRQLGAGDFLWHALERGQDHDAPLFHHLPPGGGPDDLVVYSLATLRDQTERYARWYHNAGVTHGDRVGVFTRNGMASFVHFLALNSLGAIPAVINPNMVPDTAAKYLSRLDAVGVVVDADKLGPLLNGMADARPFRFTASQEAMHAAPPAGPLPGVYPYRHGDRDPVLISHSSGTTGMPKAATFGHRQFFAGKRPRIMTLPSGPDDKMLLAFPASHSSGYSYMMMATLIGLPTLVMESQDGATVAEAMRWWKPSVVTGFPITFTEMLALGLEPSAAANVTTWISTADASHEAHVRELVRLGRHRENGSWRPGSHYLDGLGASEMGMALFLNIHGPKTNAYNRCVGYPEPIVEDAVVFDEDGRELGPNEVGYLAVHTPTVTLGYWGNHELTHKSIRNGYWLTGDIGYKDDKGRFYHYDRTTDVITTRRGPVYSLTIEEEIFKACRAVVDCAVVGVVDPVEPTSFAPIAALRLIDGADLSAEELLTRVNRALRAAGRHELAAAVISKGDTKIPLGVTGKVLKREVRAQFAQLLLTDDDGGLDVARTRTEQSVLRELSASSTPAGTPQEQRATSAA